MLVPERLEEAAVSGRHQPKGGHAAGQPFPCSIGARLARLSSLELVGSQSVHIRTHGSDTRLVALVHHDDGGAVRSGLTGGETEKKGETGQELGRAHGLGIEEGRAKFYIRVAFSAMKVSPPCRPSLAPSSSSPARLRSPSPARMHWNPPS